MKAYSYQRFSSTIQGKGSSTRRQTALIDAYCQQHTLELVESYSDLGVSAFRGDNKSVGQLGAFIQAVDSGVIKTPCALLVESLDRLSREAVLDALPLFIQLINADVEIHTLSDKQIYTKTSLNSDWTKLIVGLAVMSRANEESAIKSQRINAAHAKRWDEGKATKGKMPPWLVIVDSEAQLVPDKVAVIQRVFDMYISGLGVRRIVRTFIEENLPTMSGRGRWTDAYIQQLIREKTVIGGLKTTKGVVIDGYYPAIISEDTWLKAQAIRCKNRLNVGATKNRESPNLFSGLNYCAECGDVMSFAGKWSSQGILHSYVACVNTMKVTGKSCASDKRFRYEWMEAFVLHGLALIVGASSDDSSYIDAVKVAEGRLSDVHQLANKLGDAVALAPDITALHDKLRTAQADIELAQAELDNAKGELARARSGGDPTENIRQALGMIEKSQLSGELRRSVRAGILDSIDRITVDKTGRVRVVAKPQRDSDGADCISWCEIEIKGASIQDRTRTGVITYDSAVRSGEAIRVHTAPVIRKEKVI